MTEENSNEALKKDLLESQIHDIASEFESLKILNLEYLKTNERLSNEIKNLKELNEQQVILNDTMMDKNKEIFKGSKRNMFWLVCILCLIAILLSFQLIDKRINDKISTKTNNAIEKINTNLNTSSKSLAVSKNLQLEVQSFVNNYELIQKEQEIELKKSQTNFENILTNFKESTTRTNEAIKEIRVDYEAALNNFKTLLNHKKEEISDLKSELINELKKTSRNNKEMFKLKNQYSTQLKEIKAIKKNLKAEETSLKLQKTKKKTIPATTKKVPKSVAKQETAYELLQKAYKYQKKQYYTNAIKMYNKVLELDPKKDIAYYNLGIIYGNRKNYTQAITAYKKSIKLNPNRSLSFTNLFEMQLIANKNFDSHILKIYKDHNKTNKKSLIKYEMIDIFKDVKNHKNIDKKLHDWKSNYKNISLGNWSFTVLKKWIEKEKDTTTKNNLTLVLKTFEMSK